MAHSPTTPRVITYRGVVYHLHTGLFGRGTPAAPNWDAATLAAQELQDQSRRLYRTAQELQRRVAQQVPGAQTLGSQVKQLAQAIIERLQQVLQHAPQ